jgi:lysozyme
MASSIFLSNTSSQIERDLIRDEGVRAKPYKDTEGFLTIGVGHNLDAAGLCSEAILAQLRYDIRQHEAELDRKLPWWRKHPEPVQRVLLNMAFNLGVPGLLKFKETLGLIESKNYTAAADRLLTLKYAKQVKGRAVRLADLLRSVI